MPVPRTTPSPEPLTAAAAETLSLLLRRALAHGQFYVHRASPFPDATSRAESGNTVDDDYTGNAATSAWWPVDLTEEDIDPAENITEPAVRLFITPDELRALLG